MKLESESSRLHGCVSGQRLVTTVMTAFLLAAATGCKSGMSFSKPSWWTFGGTTADDPAKLAAAPPFDDATKSGDAITKPSAAATPYPTTTTPQAYAMNGTPSPTGSAVPAPASVSPASDKPITYGQAPPPTAASTAPPAVASSPIAPQAGPYATVPATTAPAAEPASEPFARMADNRSGSAFGQPPAAAAQPSAAAAQPSPAAIQPAQSPFGTPAAMPAAPGDSRYGTSTASRFSGAAASGSQAPSSPASAVPAVPPAAAPAALPDAAPARRPDPGYRPGGTSSYRPSRTILVGEPATESAVRTAAFEMPAEPLRQ